MDRTVDVDLLVRNAWAIALRTLLASAFTLTAEPMAKLEVDMEVVLEPVAEAHPTQPEASPSAE